jgi:hypothetical protein
VEEDGMRIYNDADDEVALFLSVRREGDRLIIDGKVLGAMRMDMIITAGEAFKGLRMSLCWAVISFALLLPYFGVRRLLKRSRV